MKWQEAVEAGLQICGAPRAGVVDRPCPDCGGLITYWRRQIRCDRCRDARTRALCAARMRARYHADVDAARAKLHAKRLAQAAQAERPTCVECAATIADGRADRLRCDVCEPAYKRALGAARQRAYRARKRN